MHEQTVSISIPTVSAGMGDILHLEISLGSTRTGGTEFVGLREISRQNIESIKTARTLAEQVVRRQITTGITITLQEPHKDVEGRSWELPIALGFLSLLTDTPIQAGTISTGRITTEGKTEPVSSYIEKILASLNANYTTFLIPFQYDVADRETIVAGMKIIPVKGIYEAWAAAVTGRTKPWLPAWFASAKDIRCYY